MAMVHAEQASADTMESQLDSGLIIGHAYSVTDVRYVSLTILYFYFWAVFYSVEELPSVLLPSVL